MELPDFSSPEWIVLNTILFFLVISGRYFFLSGLFYIIFYIWFPERWKSRKINDRKFQKGQIKTEIKWSIISAVIFAVTATITVILWQKGFTKIYTSLSISDWFYFPLSLIIYMLLQETYYYWIHRWMHIPRIFRVVHKIHHDSKISSPFTAFSFHPLEAILQAIFIPLLLLIVPIHLYVIIALLTIMSISSVVNHLDIEIYPAGSQTNFSKWVIGATHHAQHHQRYKYNFGLYFTIWDKLRKTESPDFNNLFFQKTKHRKK